ncbi:MAG: hypothetical protein KKD18_02400 [Nanoarchaeota archaeon]|nr:hypothetical protein [Nanoarchaeota archaeon]MBU0977241.1 hypothetical protein [Nanoarchaeota archaeon]
MAERVSTGGTMEFQYQKGHRPKPTKEFTIEIEEAYDRARIRKAKERRNRAIVWIVVIILILAALGIWWFTRK